MKCGCCGKDLGEIAMDKGYQMPDEIWELSAIEREDRSQIDTDLGRLDERYFIRGVAFIPVSGTEEYFGWGIWVEVPQEKFFNYAKNYQEDNSETPRFQGLVANQMPSYENTLGLEVSVQLGSDTERPTFYFKDRGHLLYSEQGNGISIEKVHGYSK